MEITENLAQPKQKKMLTRRTKRAIFYTLLVIFPMFQWCVMYVGVHINTFALAFQSYDSKTFEMTFAGFKNFQDAWYYMFEPDRIYLWKNSGIFILCSLCIKQTFTLFFSFYIYKKFPGAGLFKVMLFLPGIVSSLVYSWSFRLIVGDVLPQYFNIENMLDSSSRFTVITFYNLWLGFGAQMLIYSSGMSGIDESIVEAANVDGATLMQEFFHITIPMISRTIMIFLITGLTGFFSNSLGLYDFFGVSASSAGTIGYRVYVDTIAASYDNVVTQPYYDAQGVYHAGDYSKVSYMTLSAIGLLESMFLIPVVTGMRAFINKVAPSAD